ncbi:MAG: hypothetical protein HY050_10680 [Actinobacteria bacterium]|nr:hypothetical protein [Actinomycetota bacterium]
MTEEEKLDPKSSQADSTPESADEKGQMLVIYLPEGSVIVDRTDVNLAAAPKGIVEHVLKDPATTSTEPAVVKVAPEELQSSLQELVRLAVQEVLQTTGQVPMDASRMEASEPILEPPAAMAATSVTPKVETPGVHAAPHLRAHRLHLRRRRQVDWGLRISMLFISYLVLIAIVPIVLSSASGIAIQVSKTSLTNPLIARGDMMVYSKLPVSALKVGNVLLMRDENSWRFHIGEISSITENGADSTIATTSTTSGGRSVTHHSLVLPNTSEVNQVYQVIPKLGYLSLIFSSALVKVGGGVLILILNLIFHRRKWRPNRMQVLNR